jgi:hypothetical protein
MAKTKISEFDTNPDLNTDINSINIAEGCSPANINNAIRQLMADLKEWQNGSQDRYIAPAGTAAAPSWTFNGDTDTGFYSGGANIVGVAANGVSVGTFTSAGFVGNVTGNASGTSANVTGTVAVANGGTGATTLASGQFLKGAGTSAVTTSATVALGSEVAGTLPVANGGTGASDAGTARTNLGLGSIATQSSSSVTITGGSITGITDLTVADGGTGASNAGTARTNLDVPSRSGADASGTWGISISGNAATATTATNGGVTSVNGQTGAVTQTSVDSIGSYVVALYVPGTHPNTNAFSLSIGDTIAGSTLRYNYTANSFNAGRSDYTSGRTRDGSTTYDGGGTSLSGTWRCMGRPGYTSDFIDPDYRYGWWPGLFVRVS